MMTNAEIDALPLSARAKSFLRMARDDGKNGITMSEREIVRYPYAGRKTAREISDYRLTVAKPTPPEDPLVRHIRDVIVALENLARALERNKDRT